MQELILAKDQVAAAEEEEDDSKEDTSEEVIVTPNRVGWRSGGGNY